MAGRKSSNGNGKLSGLSQQDFVLKAIVGLRKDGYKGIHSVFSGFNDAFRAEFPDADPVKTTKELSEKGVIVVIPTKRGVTLYLPADAPKTLSAEERGMATLAKMGVKVN